MARHTNSAKTARRTSNFLMRSLPYVPLAIDFEAADGVCKRDAQVANLHHDPHHLGFMSVGPLLDFASLWTKLST